MFCREDGTPYTRDHVYGPFKRLLKSLGIDHRQYSWKELRHTTATLMHLKGAEIKSIKDQLRHTSIKMTEGFYIGSDVNYQRKQNERLALDSGKIVGNGEISNPVTLPTA